MHVPAPHTFSLRAPSTANCPHGLSRCPTFPLFCILSPQKDVCSALSHVSPPVPPSLQYPKFGWTAADVAASRGHAAALAALLDAGALEPEAAPPNDRAGLWGADPNPLHLAILGGYADCVALLLRRFAAAPADPAEREWAERFCNAQNKARAPARFSSWGGISASLLSLCPSTPPPCVPASSPSPLLGSAPKPPQEGLTPLQAAVRRRRADIVRILAACPCVRLSDRATDGPNAEPGKPARLSAYMLAANAADRACVDALCASGRFVADGYAVGEAEEERAGGQSDEEMRAEGGEGGDGRSPLTLGPHCTVRFDATIRDCPRCSRPRLLETLKAPPTSYNANQRPHFPLTPLSPCISTPE